MVDRIPPEMLQTPPPPGSQFIPADGGPPIPVGGPPMGGAMPPMDPAMMPMGGGAQLPPMMPGGMQPAMPPQAPPPPPIDITQFMPQPDMVNMMGMMAPDPEPLDPESIIKELEPKYPAWLYKVNKETGDREISPPPKPDKGTFQNWSQADHMLHAALLSRFRSDLDFYRRNDAAVFKTYDVETDEPFFSAEPKIQVNKLCNMLSGIERRVSWPFQSEDERRDAQSLEDWALYLVDRFKQQHGTAGMNADLDWEVFFSAAVYGRIIARILPDPDDWEFPWKFRLMDPAACFPTPGDKWGLLRMTTIEQMTLGRALDGFDPDGRRKLNGKMRKHYASTKQGSADKGLDLDREIEVTEVWTRWHHNVDIDG
jgi:hypothetical protein